MSTYEWRTVVVDVRCEGWKPGRCTAKEIGAVVEALVAQGGVVELHVTRETVLATVYIPEDGDPTTILPRLIERYRGVANEAYRKASS